MPIKIDKIDPASAMIIAAFLFLDIFTWNAVFARASLRVAHLYFLNVSQGDSELVILPGNIKILIDAGNDSSAADALEAIMPADDAYIDLAIISEPNAPAMNGFSSVLDHYQIGAFIYSGRRVPMPSGVGNIPLVPLEAGDKINIKNSEADLLTIIAPDALFAHSPAIKDSDMVGVLQTKYWRALFTANINTNSENFLLKNHYKDIKADILKVADHGSKYSSSIDFIQAVQPTIAIIETATKGIGGKASEETLKRLAENTSSSVFQTGKTGIIDVRYDTIRKKLIYGP